MQGSFWKTVALVAVIGVGSLAILEVQNRLKNSKSALDVSDDTDGSALTDELKAVTETSVDADLSESEFDKMLKAGFPASDQQTVADNAKVASTGFDLSEPSDSAEPAFGNDSNTSASQFSLADIGQQSKPIVDDWEAGEPFDGGNSAQASSSAKIDTNVDASSLTESPNPFAAITASSATEKPGQIEPVGFVNDEQPSFEGANGNSFAAFDPTAEDPTPAPQSGSMAPEGSLLGTNELASRQVGQAEFFNGIDRSDSNEAATKTVSADPVAFSQNGGSNVFDDSSSTSGQFEQFESNNDTLNTPSGTSSPFPGFDFESDPAAEPSQPERIPNSQPNDNNQGSPFFPEEPVSPGVRNEDLVPMPQERSSDQPSFDLNDGPGPSFDDSMSNSDSLPFVEDTGSNVPVLNPVPAPQRDDGLSIPRNPQDRDVAPGRTFDGDGLDSQPYDSNRNPNPDFNVFPSSDPGRSEEFDPRRDDRNNREMNPSLTDPFGRSNLGSAESNSNLDRRDETFGSERLDRSEGRGINPGFGSEPGRIPTMEDRSRNLQGPLSNEITDNTRRENRSLTIDPGFGSDASNIERPGFGRNDDLNRFRSDRDFDINGGSRPVREFGGSEGSQDFRSQPSTRTPTLGGNPDAGSRPLREEREFGGSTFDRQRDDLPNVDSRMRSNVRQIASVMRPNLTLQKSAPENATVGSPLQYLIIVRNDGDAPAYDVVVEDEVTSSSRVDAAKPQASRSNDGERLVWEFDSIAPGQEKEIQVQVTPTDEGVIDGVATVKFKSRVKATTMITAPRLELTMEGPAKVRLGDKVQYRYVITNEGSGEARSVFVRTVLPQNGGLRHPQGQDLEYEIPLMEPGEQREILLSVVAGEPGSQQAQALVSSRNGSKDEATWSTDVVGAQLQMLRRGPKRRFVSKTARYENIVTNETDFDAVNARVVEQIPPGMEFKAAGQNGRYNPTEKTVTWEIRRLAAKATTTLQLELEPRVAGQQDSRVTIFENIGAQSDDYVSTTVVEDLHNVSATISQLDGPVAMGEIFGFTIAVDNRGTADATDIQLSVEVPSEIQVVGAGSKEVEAGLKRGTNTVVYQMVVRIKPDQQQDFELKLRGIRPGRNRIVKASVKYTQMSEPLEISESVTIYDDRN